MKTVKFLFSWGCITFILLLCVVLMDIVDMLFIQHASETPSISPTAVYPVKDMIIGFASEGFRALLLCYLFPKIKGASDSALLSMWYGLVISGLIGSMWLIVGYGSFELKNPNKFILYDAIILTLQGITSGLALFLLQKKKIVI